MSVLQEITQQFVNGLTQGSIYALIALGYTMIYGIAKLINFAHGDVLMLGAFAGFFVLTAYGVSVPALIGAFVLAMAACAVVGILVERACYKPLRNAPRINVLITAIGVSFFLENGARVFPPIGPNPKQFPTLPPINFNLRGVNISIVDILVIVVSIVLMFILNYIVNYTKRGKAMRAVAFDRDAAFLMGISVDGIISFTFAIGAALAAAAGILFSLAYPQVEPYMGMMPGLKAFIAAVLGGIGSIPGAMVGGFILGLAETFTKGFISSELSDAIAFGILILILIVKPSGIFGKNESEKV